jgi:phage terminase large subunit
LQHEVTIAFKARPYQQELIDYFRKGGRKACEIWHRKAGKDRVATFIESELAFQRPGLYWHALPKYEDARKVIWDAIMPDGKRLVEWAFPRSICKHLDHEMKVVIPTGDGQQSIWQPVGTDNYDGLVGAFPRHITWSEYALGAPLARNFLRQALAMNDGSELVITTPRGYNHAHDLYQYAKESPEWHSSLLTVDDTGVVPQKVLDEERRTMPDELFRQEYYCDWSAANVGAILGRYVEQAEKEGRITNEDLYDPLGAPLEISSDLGRRHVSAFWVWQPRVDGFALIDYVEEAGLDAEEWVERLKDRLAGKNLRKVWLPHDARAKTFAAKHSAIEYFIAGFGEQRVEIVPRSNLKSHSINAGQVVMRHCRFAKDACKQGLAALRSWAYKWDEEKKQYSKEPVDDWAADGADAFCEGAKVMQERLVEKPRDNQPRALIIGEVPEGFQQASLNDMWRVHESTQGRRERI